MKHPEKHPASMRVLNWLIGYLNCHPSTSSSRTLPTET